MTDVGKISFGVELDASDLSAKLGEAVRRAIAPALQEIQRELQKTQREYAKTERAAAKSNAAQAEAANIAQRAIHNVGDEHTKTGAKAAAAGGISTRSINAVTRAIERQTKALAANTAARAGNAAAPTGGPVGGGGGSAGGGGPPIDRHRGGFMQGGRGRFGFLTSPLGLNLGALGIGSLGPALAVVTDLVGGVQQLGQAGLALPGIYGAAAASIGVAVAGFSGMGDAVKALNEAAKSGDPKDLEKATEAMKDMDPAAQAVAKSVSALSRGPLLDLRKQIQGRMFRDWAGELDSTANKAIPRLSGSIGGIADAWNGTLRTLTGSLGSDRNLSVIDRILGNTGEGQKRMNAAIDPLIHAVGTLTAAGSDVLPRLADGLAAGARRFDEWITRVDADGRLGKWINDGITGMHQLAESGLNLVKVVTDITKAAGSDQGGFLRWLEKATGQLHDLTSSAAGQTAMRKFFADAREMGEEWLPILKNIGEALIEVYQASSTWANILLPFLRVASDLLTAFPGLITAAGVALLAWKTSSIFKPLIGGLDNVIARMDVVAAGGTAAAGAGGKKGGGGRGSRVLGGARAGLGALSSNRGMLGLGGLAAGTATQLTAEDTSGKVLGALSTIGGGALTGAAIGSVIPGVGTAIGAAGGAAIGTAIAGVNFLLGENRQKAQEAAAAQEAYAASLEQSRVALANLQGAQKDVNDSLLAAGGNLADAGVQQGVATQLEAMPESLKSHFGEDAAKGFADSLTQLGLSNEELANQITGSQPIFDALLNNLKMMGPDGFFAASQLQGMRDQIMGMSQQAAVAGPAMQTLAEILHTDVGGAAAAVRTAVQSIPQNVPISVGMPNADATIELLRNMGYQIDIVNGQPVVINANDQKVKDADAALEVLGVKITHLPEGRIAVAIDQNKLAAAQNDMNSFFNQYQRLLITPQVQGPGVPPPPAGPPQNPLLAPFQPPRATGGVLPGFSPGKDNMLVPLGGGEGIIIPEAMRWLGSDWLYNLNSSFRGGISRSGYQDGGVHLGTGALPGPPGVETELSVLIQIRDLLGGKGGAASNPLAATAANTATSATAAQTAAETGQEIGPFGTPLKKKNRAYDAAKGALEALGFDAETIIGSDPMQQAVTTATGATGGAGGTTAVPGDPSRYAAALAAFAASGNLADVSGLGLDANDPVVKAIAAARNKKKGGLDDAAIGKLVDEVLAGGGFTGVLDESNTSLVGALQTFREKVLKGKIGAVPGMPAATSGATSGLNWDALAAKESGGNWAINTGNGYFGGLQFDQATWDAYKPAGAPARADLATKEQQIAAAQNAINQRGGPQSLWPQNYSQLGAAGGGGVPSAQTSGWFPGGTGGRVSGSKQGLQPAASNLFDVIAAQFPQIQNIGGVRDDALPYHPSGRALDIMIPGAGGLNDPTPPEGKALGDSIYNFLMQNASQLGIDTSGTLWQQQDHFNHIHAQLLDGVQQFTNAGLSAPGMGGLGAGGAGGSGTPVFVTNWPGGGGGSPLDPGGILAGLTGGVNEAAQNVVGDAIGATSGAFMTPEGERRPDAELGKLIRERNPMAIAEALGFNVQDFTRQGGAGAENITQGGGFDASGRLFSDTAGLMDRTFTSLNAQLGAMREQLVDVITQVQHKLEEEALEPVVKAGVQSALESLKDSVSAAIGTAMGNAAAPPIADAVSSAVASLPVDQSGAGNTGGQLAAPIEGVAGNLFASGGAVWGGIPGKDSVPILAQQGEFVLDRDDVARMGGTRGVEAFRRSLGRSGGLRGYATGGGVIANDVVGAEFFGVSEVPIIGAIVNLFIRVLLKMIGVEIEARDTMLEMSNDFRSFRGDAFKAFDAQGRLLNDTSGLIERTASSEEIAAAERIRILKIVIQAIIKYLIEKVIVPIAKAVANSVIQAGSSAAGAAVAGAGGGPAGGIVSSVISSAGQAGVEIAAEVGTDFALAVSETVIDMVAEGLMSQFGDQMTSVFSGGALAGLLDPTGNVLGNLVGGILGIFAGLFGGGVFGGASTLIPGIPFDEGGMAEGVGFLPKATMGDELVLSPSETTLFSRFVAALENGGFGRSNQTSVHAPITVIGGGRETAEQVENRLLKLMP